MDFFGKSCNLVGRKGLFSPSNTGLTIFFGPEPILGRFACVLMHTSSLFPTRSRLCFNLFEFFLVHAMVLFEGNWTLVERK